MKCLCTYQEDPTVDELTFEQWLDSNDTNGMRSTQKVTCNMLLHYAMEGCGTYEKAMEHIYEMDHNHFKKHFHSISFKLYKHFYPNVFK
jgi:hypothetical protein